VTGGKLTLEIGNEYLVSVSSDDQTYREVLRETNQEHDLNNLDPPHELHLNTLLGGSRTLYVRIGDSFPQDGWGGWLATSRSSSLAPSCSARGGRGRAPHLASEARQRPWKPEVAEDAGIGEPGDGRDRFALERQHEQPIGAVDRSVRVR
jgi:hypothetical protein